MAGCALDVGGRCEAEKVELEIGRGGRPCSFDSRPPILDGS